LLFQPIVELHEGVHALLEVLQGRGIGLTFCCSASMRHATIAENAQTSTTHRLSFAM
jgi:hypothetical protein